MVEASGIAPLSRGVTTRASTGVSLVFGFAPDASQGQDAVKAIPVSFPVPVPVLQGGYPAVLTPFPAPREKAGRA